MTGFLEFVQLCFQPVNLPFTVGLIGIFVYWLLFIIGAVGLEALDLDVDLDMDADLDADIDVDVDADIEADAGDAIANGPAFWISFLRFFNVGDVPMMILLSSFAFSTWAFSLLGNYYLNPTGTVWISLVCLLPNMVLSLLITKVVTTPVKHLFKHATAGGEAPMKIVGKTCLVTTGEVTPTFGQAQIQLEDGPPVTLNVRCSEDKSLVKGQEAVVIDHDEEKNTYRVIPFNLED